jgi:hypothetical protein
LTNVLFLFYKYDVIIVIIYLRTFTYINNIKSIKCQRTAQRTAKKDISQNLCVFAFRKVHKGLFAVSVFCRRDKVSYFLEITTSKRQNPHKCLLNRLYLQTIKHLYTANEFNLDILYEEYLHEKRLFLYWTTT